MGNILSTDAYPLFSWHPLLMWVKLMASAYFTSLSLRQIICLQLYHSVREHQRYMRAAHAWAHFIIWSYITEPSGVRSKDTHRDRIA